MTEKSVDQSQPLQKVTGRALHTVHAILKLGFFFFFFLKNMIRFVFSRMDKRGEEGCGVKGWIGGEG